MVKTKKCERCGTECSKRYSVKIGDSISMVGCECAKKFPRSKNSDLIKSYMEKSKSKKYFAESTNLSDKQVIVLQGISGSGKTTYANELSEKWLEERDYEWKSITVSADDYFVNLGQGTYAFDPSKLSEAHAYCFRSFLNALEEINALIIVDNTNTTAVEISPYMLAASAFGYDSKIIRINCDPKIAAARNRHGVPLRSIQAMADRIKNDKLPPYWDFEQINCK